LADLDQDLWSGLIPARADGRRGPRGKLKVSGYLQDEVDD